MMRENVDFSVRSDSDLDFMLMQDLNVMAFRVTRSSIVC